MLQCPLLKILPPKRCPSTCIYAGTANTLSRKIVLASFWEDSLYSPTTHTHARTHTRTHARTHARTHTHTHTYSLPHLRSEYVFNFDSAFELHNDIDVLKKMGLDCGLHTGTFTAEDIRQAKTMLPKAFESTLDGKLQSGHCSTGKFLSYEVSPS